MALVVVAAAAACRRRPVCASLLVQAILLLLLAITPLCEAGPPRSADTPGRRAGRLLRQAGGGALLAPLPVDGDGFPVTVVNQCSFGSTSDSTSGSTDGSSTELYILYDYNTTAYSGELCLNAIDGECMERLVLPPEAAAAAAAAYPSLNPWVWAILPDNDAYLAPANYSSVDFVQLLGGNCTVGTEDCLPKFEVDTSEGPVVLLCEDWSAPAPAGDEDAAAPAPEPAAMLG